MREREGQAHPSSPEFDAHAVVNLGVAALLEELQQGKSGRLEEYLAFAGRFHRYSAQNQLLIYLQCPHATHVAGYRTWQEMGYQVGRGQKGIRILAPRPFKRLDETTGDERHGVYFVSVSVFDASQLANLDSKSLPEFFTPLADDQQELYRRLMDIVTADGIVVSEGNTGRAQGYSAGGSIVIREGLDSRSRTLVLLHEYTHELLHWKADEAKPDKQVKECHAEAVSYIVAHHFGIHNPFSSDYLQHWGTTPKELLAEMETVRLTAALIIDRIEGPASSSEPESQVPGK
jgi:N-terminal domain of anti-restriction factor ArdC